MISSFLFISFLAFSSIITLTTAKRHHRGRKAVPLINLSGCKEPPNLEFMLNTWRNEMQISDPPMESFDEEWNSPQPEPKICEIMPKGGKASTIMDRALCPWQWRQNYDELREPKVIAEAFCLCKHARANSPAYCMRHEVAVLRRSHCDPITKLYHYTKSTHTITIGCHSVFARTARASPLSNHYRIAPLEI